MKQKKSSARKVNARKAALPPARKRVAARKKVSSSRKTSSVRAKPATKATEAKVVVKKRASRKTPATRTKAASAAASLPAQPKASRVGGKKISTRQPVGKTVPRAKAKKSAASIKQVAVPKAKKPGSKLKAAPVPESIPPVVSTIKVKPIRKPRPARIKQPPASRGGAVQDKTTAGANRLVEDSGAPLASQPGEAPIPALQSGANRGGTSLAPAPVLKTDAQTPRQQSSPASAKKSPILPAILLEGDETETNFLTGPGRKYAVSAFRPEPPAPAEPSAARVPDSLPEIRDTAKLVLIARDPTCLYAQWDLSDAQQRRYNSLSATGHLSIRAYLGSVGGPMAAMAELHSDSRHWFLHVDQSGKAYVAQLGYQKPDGVWVTVATSEVAVTPPATRSGERQDVFAHVPANIPLSQIGALLSPASPSAPVVLTTHDKAAPATLLAEAFEPAQVRASLPSEHSSERMPEAGMEAPATLPATLTYSPAVPIIPEISDLEPAQPWTTGQEQALAEFIDKSLQGHEWMSSAGIGAVIQGRDHQTGLRNRGVLSSMAAVPELPGALPTSSAPQAPPPRQGFWFNVNAELVIYGATEPNATVTIGGRTIKLRPDGSFSYRFALPDGCYELPTLAVSASGSDSRSAKLEFSRQTHYAGEVGAHPQDPALKAPAPENLPS